MSEGAALVIILVAPFSALFLFIGVRALGQIEAQLSAIRRRLDAAFDYRRDRP